MDIRLSLGTKLNELNQYPLIVTLREPLIYEVNNIDLFLVYDISGSMSGVRETSLKEALNLVIKALNSKDRLSLIQFESSGKTVVDRLYMNHDNKLYAQKVVNETIISGGTSFSAAIKELVNGIKAIGPNKDNGRVMSVIFLTDGESAENCRTVLNTELGDEKPKYDFTVNTFGFSHESKSPNLVDFSDSRDGAFYAINSNSLDKAKDYVLNVIGAMRTTSYKFVRMNIKSKYNVSKVYGEKHLSNYNISDDKKTIINEIYQFITGKDYTYVFLVTIPDDVKAGEKIFTVKVRFSDFKGNSYSTSNYLLFYEAIGCFNCYREEYCRVLAMEAIENNTGTQKNADTFRINMEIIKGYCEDDLNKNISKALNNVLNFTINNSAGAENYMYGVASEGILKRGGMNIWYSNEYQYELINDFLYNKDTRHYWERFHVPYWKIKFLRLIHRVTGVPLQFIFILLVTTVCIPLSLISAFFLKGTGRLIFNMIFGLIIQISLFDVAFLNVFISCTIVYLMLRFTKIHGGPILFTLFGYLMIVHLFHFIYYGQTLDFGASPFLFMFAIAKITFFTYAVRERNVNPAHFINQYHRYCITDEKFPNYLEFLSYIYFFPSAIYGPCFQIKDYLNYIYNREEYQKMDLKNEVKKGFIRIGIGYALIALYYYLKYNTYFQFGIFKIYEYLASDDVLAMNIFIRFLLIYGYSVFIKLFIYGFFQLIYGIFMTSGIAYYEEVVLENLKGGPDFVLDLSDKKGHCGNILKSDLGYNIGDAINNFNRSIHIYLKYCVYIRILFLRNSWIKNYFIAAIFVFIFAALWCGIYIGMYFFFAAACIIYQLHFNLELFGFYDWLDNAHIAIKIVFTIFVQYVLSMIFCMLFLYKIQMTWCYLRNYYYTPFIIVVVLYLISLVFRLSGFHKEKGEEKKRNRSKTKTKSTKKEGLLSIN
jgi:uncharacterized protein YegL